MILYRANFSTNVERVTLALAHKGIEVESRWISYDDRSEVEQVSGQPLVPVIVDHRDRVDNVVTDSMQIVAYLEHHVPAPALYPDDEARFAEMMVFIDWFNRVWKIPPNRIEAELASEEPDHMLITKLAREMATYLDGFDSLLAGRKFLFGDELSAADCCAFPVPEVRGQARARRQRAVSPRPRRVPAAHRRALQAAVVDQAHGRAAAGLTGPSRRSAVCRARPRRWTTLGVISATWTPISRS